jgi:hypothetical protein
MSVSPILLLVHVLLSVLGILTGLVVVGAFVSGKYLKGWTAFFLITTVLTNVTGLAFFPFKVSPPHIVAILSLIVLAVCLLARYGKRMQGRWRAVYIVTAVMALYLNVFVLIAQLFQKTPPLTPLQNQPPFAATQLLILALFVGLGAAALGGMRDDRAVR